MTLRNFVDEVRRELGGVFRISLILALACTFGTMLSRIDSLEREVIAARKAYAGELTRANQYMQYVIHHKAEFTED